MPPCPGNVVGRCLAPPTTLPEHGSTFQRLPRRRRGHRGGRKLYLTSFWSFGGVADVWYVGDRYVVASAQEEKKSHINIVYMA